MRQKGGEFMCELLLSTWRQTTFGIGVLVKFNFHALETYFSAMAEDLSSFIESQKRKLEQERAEMLRAQENEVKAIFWRQLIYLSFLSNF